MVVFRYHEGRGPARTRTAHLLTRESTARSPTPTAVRGGVGVATERLAHRVGALREPPTPPTRAITARASAGRSSAVRSRFSRSKSRAVLVLRGPLLIADQLKPTHTNPVAFAYTFAPIVAILFGALAMFDSDRDRFGRSRS